MRKLIATFFGIGWIPGWSGTYASVVTAVITLGAYALGRAGWSLVAAAAGVTILAIALGQRASEDFGSKDPHPFVLDEVAGMLIAGGALWLPQSEEAWITAAIALFWFRVADILKPPPARQLERLPRGWGIVLDDVAAGFMALGLTVLCLVVAARLR